MFPSESNGSESMPCSSILKLRKPEQPLQNVNLNTTSSNENSPTTSKIKRRVSFAEKKHVKEFCHSTEQGTVWDNTYEEHDSKGSSIIDQTAGVEKENLSECTSEKDYTYISVETDSSYTNRSNVVDNQLCNSTAGANEDDNVDSNLDLTTPVDCIELHDAGYPLRQTELPNVSKNVSSPFTIYRDTDEDDCLSNIDNQCYTTTLTNIESDKTCLQNLSMEFTGAIPMLLLSDTKENEQKNVWIEDNALQNNSYTDYITNYNNVSMEITQAVSTSVKSASSDLQTLGQIPVVVPSCENAKCDAVNDNRDQVVSVSPYHEKASNIPEYVRIPRSEEALFFQRTPSTFVFGNFTNMVLPTDAAANDSKTTYCNESMEITAAVTSTLHYTQNIAMNKTTKRSKVSECNSDSESNSSQHLTIINTTESECPAESRKSMTEENFTISRKIAEAGNVQNKLLETRVNLTDNVVNHSSNTIMKNIDRKETPSDQNEDAGLVTLQTSKKNGIYSSSRTDDNLINDERFSEKFDLTRISQMSESNFNDSLSKMNDALRESTAYEQDKIIELQSINAPSFMEEKSSLLEGISLEKEPVTSTITDAAPIDKKNNFDRSEPTNIECDQTETCNCQENVVTNEIKDNREVDLRVRIVINDNRIDNESNFYMTDVKRNRNKETVPLKDTAKHKKTVTVIGTNLDTNFKETKRTNEIEDDALRNNFYTDCTTNYNNISMEITEAVPISTKPIRFDSMVRNEDQVGEEKYTRERMNDNATIRDEEKEDSNVEEEPEDREKNQENLNEEMNLEQNIEIEQNIEEQYLDIDLLEVDQYLSLLEDQSRVEQQFLLLAEKLETYAERHKCIWKVHHKNFDRRVIVFSFMSNSLLIVTFLSDDSNCSRKNLIKKIKVIPYLAEDTDELIRMVHELILQKVNVEVLTQLYKTHGDFFPLLYFVTQEVQLAMEFMFDLKRLDDFNLMEISHKKVIFVTLSKNMEIILEITVKIKRFDMLTPNDISIQYRLGKHLVKEEVVKSLIRGVKKDHKFLGRYMHDVQIYVDLMEESHKLSDSQE